MFLWIPGANGLLGKTLLKRSEGFSIGTSHIEADIGDLASLQSFVRRHPGVTHIVNCAAFSQVDLSESRREEAHLANAIGPENLGRIAKEIGARLIHISTDYVFPGDLRRPLIETDPVAPVCYYGETKLEGEKRVQAIFPAACILRVSWIFGQGGKNFVARLFELLQVQEEIRLTSDQWGRPTYAPDLANAILQMLDCQGLYHFANKGIATKYDFGLAMREEALRLGYPVKTKSIVAVPGSTFPSPCRRPIYSAFDTSKIETELKIQPRPWQHALREFLMENSHESSPC